MCTESFSEAVHLNISKSVFVSNTPLDSIESVLETHLFGDSRSFLAGAFASFGVNFVPVDPYEFAVERIVSHMCMRRVSHMNDSYHICACKCLTYE